jgi:heme oxygenase
VTLTTPKEVLALGIGAEILFQDSNLFVLVEGRLYVLGTELRKRAYDLVQRHMPYSTALLELGRLAAWVGSNLGAAYAFLYSENDQGLELRYIMDMADAEDPDFLDRLGKLGESGHPMGPEAVRAFSTNFIAASRVARKCASPCSLDRYRRHRALGLS